MNGTSWASAPWSRACGGLVSALAFGLAAFAGSPGNAEPFQGAYRSTYGAMTLHRVGTYVFGEYGGNGVLAGRIEGSCASGTYINGSTTGGFRFDLTAGDDIDGRWGAHDAPLTSDWTATRTGPASVQLRNFARGGGTTQRIANPRTDFDGRFSSTFGEIDVHARDLFLLADYADRGVAIGMWDGTSYVGKFNNGDRTGWFDWAFLSRTADFRSGEWGWSDGSTEGPWTLIRRTRGAAAIDNLPSHCDDAPGGRDAADALPPAGLAAAAEDGRRFGTRNAAPPASLDAERCTNGFCTVSQPLNVATDSLWPLMPIQVCWENATLDNEQGRLWTRDAVERTWAQESRARFSGWGGCPGGRFDGIRIRVEDGHPHVKGLGTNIRGRRDGMSLNFTFANFSTASCAADREFCIRTIAVHEFGHALGFAHEHNRGDRIPEGCHDAPQGSTGDWNVTPYDLDSVMNYCNPSWSGNGRLSRLDVQGVRRLYGIPTTNSFTLEGLGHRGEGAGLAVGLIDGNDRPDAILMAYDAPSGANNFRYRVIHDLDATGKPGRIGAYVTTPGTGHSGEGAGAALGDVDGNGQLDIVLMAIDAPSGANSFTYKVGFDLDAAGRPARWDRWRKVSGLGHSADGGGVALADVDGNGVLDLVLMAYDDPSGANTFVYKIGFDLGPDGQVRRQTDWRTVDRVAGLGHAGEGAGIAIGDLDGDGRQDMVLLAYDAPKGPNTFRYRVVWGLDRDGRPSSAGTWGRHMTGRGHSGAGAGLAMYDVDEDGNQDLIVMTYDDPPGQNTFRYDVVFDVY